MPRLITPPEYTAWHNAIQRCENPKNPGYPRYGGRGIRVCQRWRRSSKAFLDDMGQRPAGTTLERIDNDGHYEPGNCRWATQHEQAMNKDHHNRRKTHCLQGHPYVGDNVYWHRGHRKCRTCHRVWCRAYHAKQARAA